MADMADERNRRKLGFFPEGVRPPLRSQNLETALDMLEDHPLELIQQEMSALRQLFAQLAEELKEKGNPESDTAKKMSQLPDDSPFLQESAVKRLTELKNQDPDLYEFNRSEAVLFNELLEALGKPLCDEIIAAIHEQQKLQRAPTGQEERYDWAVFGIVFSQEKFKNNPTITRDIQLKFLKLRLTEIDKETYLAQRNKK